MSLHPAEISTQVAAGAHAVAVCHGAGRHQRGSELHVPDTLTLLTLPPYSPELNPMENVRDDLRQNKLGTFLWNSDDESLKATKSAWTWLIADPHRIRSIGARAWAMC